MPEKAVLGINSSLEKSSPEKSLDFWSQKSVLLPALGRFHLIIPGNQKTEFRNYTCMRIYINLYRYTYLSIRLSIHTCIYTYIHTYIHTCVCVCVYRVCVCACIACVHIDLQTDIHVCVRARMDLCVRTRAHSYVNIHSAASSNISVI